MQLGEYYSNCKKYKYSSYYFYQSVKLQKGLKVVRPIDVFEDKYKNTSGDSTN